MKSLLGGWWLINLPHLGPFGLSNWGLSAQFGHVDRARARGADFTDTPVRCGIDLDCGLAILHCSDLLRGQVLVSPFHSGNFDSDTALRNPGVNQWTPTRQQGLL